MELHHQNWLILHLIVKKVQSWSHFQNASDELNKFDDFSTKAGFTTAELQELLIHWRRSQWNGSSADASAEFSKQVAELSGDIGSLEIKIQNKFFEQSLRLT